MKLLDIQNYNSFTGNEMTEIAVTKQPKKKIRVRNNRNYGYELTGSRVVKKVETLPPYY